MQKQHKDLTGSQWQIIEKIIDNRRKRKICLKTVFSACLWLTRTGSQWRNLAQTKYPAWQTVAYYFYKWQKDGTWQQCLESLSKQERERQKRISTPSRVAVDSQSVKQSGCFSGHVGVDGHKR
jgi:transposase